jgi:hypothetical protein
MKTIVNRTTSSLRINLPGGHVLHLAPGKTGQISDDALEDSAVEYLITAGKVEVVREGPPGYAHGSLPHHAATSGHRPAGVVRPKGDR